MRLIDKSIQENSIIKLELADRAFDVLGVSRKSAEEFTYENMAAFNAAIEDAPEVQYYSIGSKKKGLNTNNVLRYTHSAIYGANMLNESDGLVLPREAEWGKYLVTFDYDHLEMGTLTPRGDARRVYRLVMDNLKLKEALENPRDAEKYGVDGLSMDSI